MILKAFLANIKSVLSIVFIFWNKMNILVAKFSSLVMPLVMTVQIILDTLISDIISAKRLDDSFFLSFKNKRDFCTGASLWILKYFLEHLFLLNNSGGCFFKENNKVSLSVVSKIHWGLLMILKTFLDNIKSLLSNRFVFSKEMNILLVIPFSLITPVSMTLQI